VTKRAVQLVLLSVLAPLACLCSMSQGKRAGIPRKPRENSFQTSLYSSSCLLVLHYLLAAMMSKNGNEGMTQSSQRKSQKSAPSSVCAFTNSCILYPLYLRPTTLTPVHVRGCVIIIYFGSRNLLQTMQTFRVILKEVAAVERRCLLVHF